MERSLAQARDFREVMRPTRHNRSKGYGVRPVPDVRGNVTICSHSRTLTLSRHFFLCLCLCLCLSLYASLFLRIRLTSTVSPPVASDSAGDSRRITGVPPTISIRVDTCDRLRVGWLNGWEGFRESRGCSRDTWTESYITECASRPANMPHVRQSHPDSGPRTNARKQHSTKATWVQG